jgi:hypothetical protein
MFIPPSMDALNYSVQFVLPFKILSEVCYNETDKRSDPKQSKSRDVVAFLKVINHIWMCL